MSKQNFHPFKVTGTLAHQRPKKYLDLTRIIYARDAVHAAEIYQGKLKGVKKRMLVEVAPLSNEFYALRAHTSA